MRGFLLYFAGTCFRAGPGAAYSPLDVAQSQVLGSADHVSKRGPQPMLPANLAPTSGTTAGYTHVQTTNQPAPLGTSTLMTTGTARIRAGPE